MELLEQEIVKLLAKDAMHAGEIRNRLNGFPLGLDGSQGDVLRALRGLEGQFIVESRFLSCSSRWNSCLVFALRLV